MGLLVIRGMRKKAEAGGYPHCAPLGYRNVRGRSGARIEPDPRAAGEVARLFTLAAEGYSLKEILSDPEVQTFRSRRGRPLGASSLRSLLSNPVYSGHTWLSGSPIAGTHVAIVERELWENAQERLLAKRRKRSGS